MTENDRKKNKGSGGLGAIVWIVIVLAGIAVRNGGDSAGPLIAFLLPVAAVAVLVGAMKAAKKKGGAGPGVGRAAPERVTRSAAPERTRAVRPSVPLELPEDFGGSDTDRDRLRRRQQLDAFLKNGIIDRKEYQALLERHERRGG